MRAMSNAAKKQNTIATMMRTIRRRRSQPVHAGSGGAVGMSSAGCGLGKCVAAAARPELVWAPASAELCSALGGARAPAPTRAQHPRALDLVLGSREDRREKSSREPPGAGGREHALCCAIFF